MSHDLSPEYWNSRYLDNTFTWDIGYISTPLKAYIDQLNRKDQAILIPGAGSSYEAEYMVKQGFTNVYVCDFAEEPLKSLQQRCPEFKSDHLLHSDFFELKDSCFDLIIEQTFFCALHPTLRKKYAEKMNSLLKPRGKLVGLLFNDIMNTDKPPFGGNMEEYIPYFEGFFRIRTMNTCYNSIPPRAGRELFINLEKI